MQNYTHPFVKHVKQQCKRYGCKFSLTYKSNVICDDDDESCFGYFRDEPLELVVATRCLYTEFLSTLVHEYSHFEQWTEGSKFFSGGRVNFDYSWTIVQRWMDGEKFTNQTVKKAMDVVRACELDCERRSVENIKKYKIPVNVKNYCKRASSYIYFYNFVKKYKIWDTKHNPADFPVIIKEMPDNLNGDYTKTPRKIMKLYVKHLTK